MNDNYRIRVGVVLIEQSKILLVKMHRENSRDIYVLPGGGVHHKESLVEAAIREIKEETNLDIKLVKILYLKSLHSCDDGSIEIIFLGKISGGLLKKGYDPEDKGKNILKEVNFLDISNLKNINFHPKQLKNILEEDFKNGFRNDVVYLGNFEYPES